MNKEVIVILVIVGLAIFVWLPAIIISIRKAIQWEKGPISAETIIPENSQELKTK